MGAREEGGGVGSEWEIAGLEAGVRSGCRQRVVADGYGGVLCVHASVPPFQGVCGMGAELEVVVSLDAERPSHCPHRRLGPWPLAVPTRASPQCLTRTHAPQSGCMAVLGYRCTAFNWGAISRPQASYTGLHPTDARSKSEYSLTHSLTHSLELN